MTTLSRGIGDFMPKRAGSFSGTFEPHTLHKFRNLCLKQGKQYTKVLERLAEAYIYTEGSILYEPSIATISEASEEPATMGDLQELVARIQVLEEKLKE